MGFVKHQSVLLESTHPDVGKIFTDPWNTEDSKFKTKVGFLIRDFSSFLGSLETLVAILNCNQLFSEQQSTYRPIDCLFVLVQLCPWMSETSVFNNFRRKTQPYIRTNQFICSPLNWLFLIWLESLL